MRFPETEEPVTRGSVVIDRGEEERRGKPANALHAFSQGAIFGLIVAGQILYDLYFDVLTKLANAMIIQDQCANSSITCRSYQWSSDMDRTWIWYSPPHSPADATIRGVPHHFFPWFVHCHKITLMPISSCPSHRCSTP
jgi:hypothetical protein